MTPVSELTITQAREHLLKGDITVSQLVEGHRTAIENKNNSINAYLEVYDDLDEQIQNAQEKIDTQKDASPILTGIPIALKDNILREGKKASCSSKILENYTAVYDAHIVSLLKKQGVVFLGRTNMDEFAMGSSTENSAFGATKNPLDVSRVPGGSSGGSAAALAMGGALGAYGSDTGGSIRQPASFCGVVGLKPTYGSVSRRGLVALASSLDQIGPFAKTCEDARLLFNAISSHDEKDSTSHDEKTRAKIRGEHFQKRVIGVPYHLFKDAEGVDKDVVDNLEQALVRFRKEGYEIRTIELPFTKYALSAYYVLLPAEASSNLARFDGVRYGLHKEGDTMFEDYDVTRGEGFGDEVRRRILLGTYVLSAGYYDAYYNKAVSVREKIQEELSLCFEEVDVIMTPTTPTPAFKIGEKADNPLSMYFSDIFTVSANIAGAPALSVPSGMVVREGVELPVGLHIIGPHFSEEMLLDIGAHFEELQS